MNNDIEDRIDRSALGFGATAVRPLQRRAIHHLIAGRDVLAVMPTGYGKSLCHQVTSDILGGVTLLVAPTVSLVRDQTERLRSAGKAAHAIDASTDGRTRRAISDSARSEPTTICLSPEMLLVLANSPLVPADLVRLIVLDEIHCLYEWGTTFRPDYLRVPALLDRYRQAARLGLTASASPECRERVSTLALRSPVVVEAGQARPNLRFEVSTLAGVTGGPDDPALRDYVTMRRDRGAVIVYRSSRKGVDDTAAAIGADRYHAGMERSERTRIQDRFLSGEGGIVVATSAFGMGIDRSDVGTVLNLDVPGDVESLHQQNGRAGRGGAPAVAVLARRPGGIGRAMARIRDLAGVDAVKAESALEWVLAVLEAPTCRMRAVHARLGEAGGARCGNCDLCDVERSFRPAPWMAEVVGALDRRECLSHPELVALASGVARIDRKDARRELRRWLAEGILDLDSWGMARIAGRIAPAVHERTPRRVVPLDRSMGAWDDRPRARAFVL